MAFFNVQAAASAANNVTKIFNVDFINALQDVAGVLRSVPESEVLDDALAGLAKMESSYNNSIVPILKTNNKVLEEDIPSLNGLINKTVVSTVRDRDADNDLEEINTDNFSINI